MTSSTIRTKYCWLLIILICIIYIALPLQSTAATFSQSTNLEVLNAKVDILQKTNDKILNTVYWTLATLSAIFLGLISINLLFNISANKREFKKNREEAETLVRSLIRTAEQDIGEKNNEDIQKEIGRIKEEIANITTSAIKTSEANLIEKTNAVTKQEIEKASTNIYSTARNEILTSKAEITKLYEESGRRVTEVVSTVKKIEERLTLIDVGIKELEAYKFSQQGKMGSIIRQLELLEYDLENRKWNLKSRLSDMLIEVNSTMIDAKYAEQLKELLGRIDDKNLEEIVKKVLNSIIVKKT